MKTFKTFLSEAEKNLSKPPTKVDTTRERQNREKEELRTRQTRELEKAKQDDFKKKEAENRQKEAQKQAERQAKQQESTDTESDDVEYVPEYLEDGTLVLVKNYKANTPGQ
jgi:DNA-nicking Smr family endonuclease